MTDYHINIFFSVGRWREAWIAAARDAGKAIPEPRYRPVIYQTER